ncbi:MAG: rhodanese [Leptospiraceae bacterium]|nr:rhodanese [Leptospiraceae bacterium]
MEISCKELKQKMGNNDLCLIDVRQAWETEIVRFSDSLLLTDELVEEMINKWDKEKEIIFYCHHGFRSMQAVMYFKQQGFSNAKSLHGGINAYSLEIDSSYPRY